MGAINFFTSDYITLAIKPYETDDFMNDPEFMEEAQSRIEKDGSSLEIEIQEAINNYYDADQDNIQWYLDNKYSFYYFHVTIKPGYYESFSIDIESNFPVAFDTCQDKREAQKEITQIKRFLIDCANCGMVETWPGWCTKYSSYKETIKAINKAVSKMREDVKITPTWNQYNRECGVPC